MTGADRRGRAASVAVIVVNYGTAELAAAAVDSVLAQQHGRRPVEIHLVDNASPGGDAARLQEIHAARAWGAQVTLWPETRNHGFGEGNNVVLRALAARPGAPDFVFLLNPDAWLENEVIDRLAAALEADPEAAAAGAALSGPDGTPVASAFRFPGLASEIGRMVAFGPLERCLAGFRVALPPPQPPGPVDWVTGAAVMFRLPALAGVGFFDPGFFLYYEEVDLMRRLGVAGHRVLHVPSARVSHHEGAATGVRADDGPRRRNPDYLYTSWRLYFTKSRGRTRALALALLMLPAAVLNVLHRRLRGRSPTLPLAFFGDHWRLVVRPLIAGGMEP